jgi:putative addiction module antidote
MVKTISKVGNSNMIRLDKALMELLNLETGDRLVVTVRDGSIVLTPENVGFAEEEIGRAADEIMSRHARTFRKLAE